ncbi:MAG TPA: ATP-binding protein [Stellaceae bacterium]|nr:ATP-binding protein [Stellaceae bacterium]
MIGLAGGLVLVVVLLGALLFDARRRRRAIENAAVECARQRDELAGLAETSPLAAFHWRPGEAAEAASGLGQAATIGTPSYRDFLGRFDNGEAARIEAARSALTADGIPFSTVATARAGAAYRIDGRRTAAGGSVLWLADVSAEIAEKSARAQDEARLARLGEVFDAMPLPMWQRGMDLAIVDCNPAYAAALDASRDTVIAEARELAARGGREEALRFAASALSGPRSERRHLVIAGERRLVEITEIPVPTGGTIGYAVDRTDVETAETELSRHIEAHAGVLESIQTAVAIYGADRRLKFANAGFAALWGIEEEWLAAEPLLDEVLERLREARHIPEVTDFPAFKREHIELFTSLIEPLEELLHLPDGRTLRLLMTPHPFGGLTFVYEDVTDRLALERSYNTLAEVQRATLDNLHEGIAVFGSDGRMKLHNPAYRQIWGLKEGDLAGEPHIADIVEKVRPYLDGGADWPARKADIIEKITTRAPSIEPLERRDGSSLQLATVPLPDGNMLFTCLDVSDTARVERALRERNEALETMDRLKSEFIANVSYELRTPLNAVIGFAEILANRYFGDLNPRQLEYSRGILDGAQQLMTLINDILDLATIEAGYMVLETAETDLSAIIESVLTLTRERARSQELTLLARYPPDVGTIEGDERRLRQALFNLVSNAVKFTPPGGTITIAAERLGSEVVLTVADTGIGIAATDHGRVFEKFERGDRRARQSGAGLGLSLVKSLIELHGGSVTLESAPGEGTRVICRLPATPAAAATAAR